MNRGVKIVSKKAALDILSTKKWFFYQRLEEHVYLASIYRAHGVLNIINEKNLCPLWPHKIKIMVLKWKLFVTSWVVSLLDNAPTTLLGTLSQKRCVLRFTNELYFFKEKNAKLWKLVPCERENSWYQMHKN